MGPVRNFSNIILILIGTIKNSMHEDCPSQIKPITEIIMSLHFKKSIGGVLSVLHTEIPVIGGSSICYKYLQGLEDNVALSCYSLIEGALTQLYNTDQPFKQHAALIFLNRLNEFFDALNQIYAAEATSSNIQKPRIYLVWAQCSNFTYEQFRQSLLSFKYEYLPKISSQVHILFHNPNCVMLQNCKSNLKIIDVYSIGRENMMVSTELEIRDIENPFSFRRNFKRAHIITIVPLHASTDELSLKIGEDQQLRVDKGLNAHLFHSLEYALNMKIVPLVSTNDDWMSFSNGNWTGIGAYLNANEADISGVKVTSLAFRAEAFTLLMPHYVEQVFAFFKQPPASTVRIIFFRPLSEQLWLAFMSVWAVLCIFVLTVSQINTVRDHLKERDAILVGEVTFLAFAISSQQGWTTDPKSLSLKLILLLCSILSLVVFVAYSSKLIAVLTTPSVPIKNFDDLLASKLPITAANSSSTIELVLGDNAHNSADLSVTEGKVKLMKMRIPSRLGDNYGVSTVLHEDTAFISYGDAFYNSKKFGCAENCQDVICRDIFQVPVSQVPFRSGFVAQKNSPYKIVFNEIILRLYENGIVRYAAKKHVTDYLGVCESRGNIINASEYQLGLPDLVIAFLLIAGGIVVSFLVYCAEKIFSHRKIYISYKYFVTNN